MPYLNLLCIPKDLLPAYEAQNYSFGDIKSNPAFCSINVNPKEKKSSLQQKKITSDLSKKKKLNWPHLLYLRWQSCDWKRTKKFVTSPRHKMDSKHFKAKERLKIHSFCSPEGGLLLSLFRWVGRPCAPGTLVFPAHWQFSWLLWEHLFYQPECCTPSLWSASLLVAVLSPFFHTPSLA